MGEQIDYENIIRISSVLIFSFCELSSMSKLIRWDTPFTEAQFPSVGLLITTKFNKTDIVKAVVAPYGVDQYPKYLVDFGEALAFSCMEEANAPKMDYVSAEIDENKLCSYEFLDSPWLRSYEPQKYFVRADVVTFSHYLIFGGDNNIEVITPDLPTIETITQPTMLKLQYEL